MHLASLNWQCHIPSIQLDNHLLAHYSLCIIQLVWVPEPSELCPVQQWLHHWNNLSAQIHVSSVTYNLSNYSGYCVVMLIELFEPFNFCYLSSSGSSWFPSLHGSAWIIFHMLAVGPFLQCIPHKTISDDICFDSLFFLHHLCFSCLIFPYEIEGHSIHHFCANCQSPFLQPISL